MLRETRGMFSVQTKTSKFLVSALVKMSEPPILQLDIKKLCVDYLRTQRIVANENDVNVILRTLKVIPEDDMWTHIVPADNDLISTVTVKFINRRVAEQYEFDSYEAEQYEFDNYEAEQDDTMATVYVQGIDNFCRITIDNLVIAGLPEANIHIPLHVGELHDEFGTYFEIDACTGIFEQTRHQQRDLASSVRDMRMENELTTARIQRTKKEATYTFKCTVVMDALLTIGLYSGVREIDVATVIRALKSENNPQYRFLDSVEVFATRVEFPLSGTGEFRWQCHDKITWS